MEFRFDRQCWQPYLEQVFQQLHAMPEPAWQEYKTTQFLQQQLASLGYQTITFADCTGVVGMLGSGSCTVALRADMDALCHRTDKGDRVIHSCGHDAHMAMVLTAAAALRPILPRLNCRLKIIFQPAEETGQGARRLVEKGLLDDVNFLFGVHLRPVQELAAGQAAPAIQNGAACLLQGTVKGQSAHGARPHLGVNVIEVAAMLVQLINGLRWDPRQPASIKMTSLRAGQAAGNIIPDLADFTLDVRAQTNRHLDQLVQAVERLSAGLAGIYGADIKLTQQAVTPAAQVNEQAMEIMAHAITDTLGGQNLAPPVQTPGAEDFHYYTSLRPAIKATMLGLGCRLTPGLHHPDMVFERQYLPDGAAILARAVCYAAAG
ncbi:M20 peptidase aminoacylase family protein [Desulfotomaculum varum]